MALLYFFNCYFSEIFPGGPVQVYHLRLDHIYVFHTTSKFLQGSFKENGKSNDPGSYIPPYAREGGETADQQSTNDQPRISG
jgi:hypothetical protein